MPPYLRAKTRNYPVAGLTALRVGASPLQRTDDNTPCVTSSGSTKSPCCPHCSEEWAVGVNRHLLMYCPAFGFIRQARISDIIAIILRIMDLSEPDRDTSRYPPTDGEILVTLLGMRPQGLADKPDARTARIGIWSPRYAG
jgi:hypothetical protein